MEFKVGDRVKIREWDDMAKEFGTDPIGNINILPFNFVKEMQILCGRECVIEGICASKIELGQWDNEDGLNYWNYTTNMIVKVEDTDTVNHPEHYTQSKHECIDEMITLFGLNAVIGFCKCNIHKYRYRANQKGGDEDLKKADWYMDKLIELEAMCDER